MRVHHLIVGFLSVGFIVVLTAPVLGTQKMGDRLAERFKLDPKKSCAICHDAGKGEDEGERALDLLAAHPSTARHIAFKLAQRFVADEPPAALVERAAARFRATDGNLREVVRVIVTSPEFAPKLKAARFAPVKVTPFVKRATGTSPPAASARITAS